MTRFNPLPIALIFCVCILTQGIAIGRSITQAPAGHFTRFAALFKRYVEDGRLPQDRCVTAEAPALKVFVYPLPTQYTFYASLRSGEDAEEWESMYMTEFIFYERLLSSCFAVEARDASDADLYFVPAMVAWHMHRGRPAVGFAGGHSFLDSALAYIRREFPFWGVNAGADHVWLVAHDIGSCLGPTTLQNSVFLQPYGQRDHFDVEAMLREDEGFVESESFITRIQHSCYSPSKDIVIPPYVGNPDAINNVIHEHDRLQRGPRKIHAYFRGSVSGNVGSGVYSGGVRQWLFNERVRLNARFGFHVYGQHLPSTEAYFLEMAQATFCISPAGWVSWSPRMFQAIAVQCIPVLIGPTSDLPFAALEWFDHTKFTIRFDGEISELPEYLESVSEETIATMQQYLSAVWRRFTYKSSEGKSIYEFHKEGPDAFDMTMDMLRERYGSGRSNGFSLKDKLLLEISQSCVLLPRIDANVETVVPLSDAALNTITQAHVDAFGGATEVIREHLARQLELSRYRRLEGRNYMEVSSDVSCFVFHRSCLAQTKRIGNCILFGRQTFDLFSTDVEFYGSQFFDRARKVVLTHWPSEAGHGVKSAREVYERAKDLTQIYGCFDNTESLAASHLLQAGFCQLHLDKKHLLEDLADIVGVNLNCTAAFKVMKCTDPCLTSPSKLKDVYVVNLKRRQDKWEAFTEHYKDSKISFPLARHEAVDGLKTSLSSAIKRLFDPSRSVVHNPYEDHAFRRGVLGCALSHLQLWAMLELSGTAEDDVMLVLEDDAEFVPGFMEKWNVVVSAAMSDSSWDVLYLGFSDFQDLYNDVYIHKGIRAFSMLPRNHGGGTFAYMIRKKGARTLRHRAHQVGIRQPIDWFMIEAFRSGAIRAYLTDPVMIVSTPVQSEGSNTHELYPLRMLPLICSRLNQEASDEEAITRQIARAEVQSPVNGSLVSSDGVIKTRVIVSEGVAVERFQMDLECYRLCIEVTFRDEVKGRTCMLLWEKDELRLEPGWFEDSTLPIDVAVQPVLYSPTNKRLILRHSSFTQMTVVPPVDIVIRPTGMSILLVAPDVNELAASHSSSLLCFTHADGNTCLSFAALPKQIAISDLSQVRCLDVTGKELASAGVQLASEERNTWRINVVNWSVL